MAHKGLREILIVYSLTFKILFAREMIVISCTPRLHSVL